MITTHVQAHPEPVGNVLPGRPALVAARRVVVKVGTQVVLDEGGRPALARLYGLMEGVATLRSQGREVLWVTSGAVGLGARQLGIRPTTLAEKQACAAVGQGELMGLYQEGFGRLGLRAAQVLLTEDDFQDARRHANLRHTLDTLLRLGAVPVLNENDAVSTLELGRTLGHRRVFGDNDRLSALVAADLRAQGLILLSDVTALFSRNPKLHADAEPIREVPVGTTPEATAEGQSVRGRGGMASKLEAATLATQAGVTVCLASGHAPEVLQQVLSGAGVGTCFHAGRRSS